jgi:iron complex outermembrane recepter protein
MAPFALRKSTRIIGQTVALLLMSLSGYAQTNTPVNLNAVDVSGKAPVTLLPTETAQSQAPLDATSAKSIVSDTYIRNFVSPIADYTQVLNATPGAFSYSPNGVGLGDTKVTIRGLADGNSVISFDGIPFNDTNGVSHHSWTFFPSQFIGGATVDRSPGSAAAIGQATYGGSFDLKSRVLSDEKRTDLTASIGTWNTSLYNIEHTTGKFGENGENNFLFNVHQMNSDGYQTYNKQDRTGYSGKFERVISGDTKVTAFASWMDLKNNTPNIKGIARSDYNNGVYNNLLSGDSTKANYYGYNFYDVPSDFAYIGLETVLGGGWSLDDKVYRYSYHNKQNYNGTTITTTSAVDKLNSYTTWGNILRLSKETESGTLRTGVWFDRADSYRYQIKSDPRTWVDVAAPNFREKYVTTTIQPYVEHEFKVNDKLKITPGIKYSSYSQDFVHDQDNGGAVGTLGGTLVNNAITGGAANVENSVKYTNWLPSLSANYKLQPNWSTYAQYSYGDQIPSTSVFDVIGAKVSPVPKPTLAKVAQLGTVWNSPSMTLAADVYRMDLDSAYTKSATVDANGNFGWFANGKQINQGIEAEANFALGQGFSLYTNATLSSFKYESGLWVAGAPKDTETLALNYIRGPWKANFSVNRIGRMYNDGSTSSSAVVNEAFSLDPVVVSNLFVNYTFQHPDALTKETKLQVGVTNLFNEHKIVGIANATAGSTSAAPNSADLLTVLPGRSVNLTVTTSF